MSSIQHRRLIYLTGELFFPFFCHPFDKHSHWTQLLPCSGVIPNVCPTDLLTRLCQKKFSSSDLESFDFKV